MPAADTRPLAIALMGPTASGKTQAAIDLATRWPAHLISVDSALVYRHLDIGSAKPDAATLARFPHELVNVTEPTQPYSAADFVRDALAAIERARDLGRLPILVGGTGLYFRALTQGLSDMPESSPDVRAALEQEQRESGLGVMHERLAALDPVAAARIHRNDPQRIVRALEVITLSGQPISALQGRRRPQLPVRLLKLIACPADRGVLHGRIALRFRQMLEQGLVDEVRHLRALPGIHADLPAMRAVGYRQAWEFLDGQFSESELADRGVFATRQLAKRQITWLRSEPDAFWLDSTAPSFLDNLIQRVDAALTHSD
ncbi:MAG: tRNA (adenosine(37)-N6)-dimethylallyltransferase MiaA [Ahniella sp.]|nr:tRNA (adenosine(37)-N6)-dimethylallyltransferase MiaA [Ahniella sp.]